MKAFDNMSFVTSSFDQSMTLWNEEDGKAVSVFKGMYGRLTTGHC